MSLSPRTDPALSDDDVVPVRGVIALGEQQAWGETPLSVQLVIEHFTRAKIFGLLTP